MAKTSRRVDSTLMLTSPKSPKFEGKKITLKCNEKIQLQLFLSHFISRNFRVYLQIRYTSPSLGGMEGKEIE